jgi:hypothetical protein
MGLGVEIGRHVHAVEGGADPDHRGGDPSRRRGRSCAVPPRHGVRPVLGAETLVEVDLPSNSRYWRASFESGLGITGRPGSSSLCNPPQASSQFGEAFSYRGDAGCLQGTGEDGSQVSAVVLQVDGTERIVHNYGSPLTGYEIEDLKRLLAEITVAPSTDMATWFDLRTAFGG